MQLPTQRLQLVLLVPLYHRLRLDRLGRFLGGQGVRGWQRSSGMLGLGLGLGLVLGKGFCLGLGLGLRCLLAHHLGQQLRGLALLNKYRSSVLATF